MFAVIIVVVTIIIRGGLGGLTEMWGGWLKPPEPWPHHDCLDSSPDAAMCFPADPGKAVPFSGLPTISFFEISLLSVTTAKAIFKSPCKLLNL